MSTVVRALLIAVLLTVLPVGAAVLLAGGDSGTEPAAPLPSYTSTPLAGYDTSMLTVARAGFCGRIPPGAVSEALGGDPTRSTDYDNGDEAELVARQTDVAHEYGCTYDGPRGAEARAWVFAPPVTAARARELVDEATSIPGCARQQTAPAYGDPGVALVCTYQKDSYASFRGLFGDAWLACSLGLPKRVPEQTLLDRAGRWCVAVAGAASIS
ncbi:MAG TPA: hypothetical protein VNS55_12670 [Nocardioides sp.]|nr:hypothetical protein [Nocardioides sp.]